MTDPNGTAPAVRSEGATWQVQLSQLVELSRQQVFIHAVALEPDSADTATIGQLIERWDTARRATGNAGDPDAESNGEVVAFQAATDALQEWFTTATLMDDLDAFFPYDGAASPRGHYGYLSSVRDLMMQLVADSLPEIEIDPSAVGAEAEPDLSTSLVNAEYEMLVEALSEVPLPVFGSPPRRFTTVAQVLTVPGTGLVGYGVFGPTRAPVLALITPAGAFLVWLGPPMAKVARRSLAERLADAVGARRRPHDLA